MSQNVLLITTDQHQRTTLGCYGASICRTPHLDRLAQKGMRFTHAFTNTAICTPARTSLLTGYLPFRHGMLANFERNVGYPWEIPDGHPMLSHYLKDADYVCGNVGKWHVGLERGPDYYGFEGEHYIGWHPPYDHPKYRAYLKERGLPDFRVRDEVRGTLINGEPAVSQMGVHDAPVEATFCHYLADETIEYLERYANRYHEEGKPFFLASQFFGPHLPYILPEEVLNQYDPNLVERHPSIAETFNGKPTVHSRYNEHWAFDTYSWETWQRIVAAYWGYVTLIDAQIGRILAALDRLGLTESTTIIFTSDHSGFVGHHRLADKGPAMYDDIYRIPMIIKSPQQEQAGTVCEQFVTLVDLMPTILDLGDVPVPEGIHGKSLVPLLDSPQQDWAEAVFAEFHGHHFPYPQRMIRTKTHKLVINPADINELYDLDSDPYELNNVYGHPAYHEVQVELMSKLYKRLVELGDNFHHWLPTLFEIDQRYVEKQPNHGQIVETT
ncbi:MAG: sulfatase-like hydrolase/transferase [Anaerolineae bacterium]|nr:sulfatase-like hydrolase/transferase [Anaerolineae bacterium]